MTTDCTRCGAATATHMLTAIDKMHRGEARTVKGTLLCPACYHDWWEAETGAALSLVAHPGRHGPKPRVAP